MPRTFNEMMIMSALY